MELGPIFRALMHNKARFWLITLEVALTLAIVANCVSLALDLRAEFLQPTGYDEESLIVVNTLPFAPELAEDDYREVVLERDLERLRALPGVAGATAVSSVPLSGGGSSTGRRPAGSEMQNLPAPYITVASDALHTFGARLVAGRDFVPADFALEETAEGTVLNQPVILSRAMADGYFPDGDALGKVIESSEGESSEVIVGIVEPLYNFWPSWERFSWLMLYPGEPGSARRVAYLVRAEPGARDAVFAELEATLIASEPGRIVEPETLVDVKRDSFGGSLALMKILSAVIVLLVLVTSLGIFGLTAFSVTQRTRQIGTRRALGATRGDILRYFLLENWLITGIGLVLGVGLTIALNLWLVEEVGAPKMDWRLLAGGMLLLWGTGVLAALMPAFRATRVSPEVATRTV